MPPTEAVMVASDRARRVLNIYLKPIPSFATTCVCLSATPTTEFLSIPLYSPPPIRSHLDIPPATSSHRSDITSSSISICLRVQSAAGLIGSMAPSRISNGDSDASSSSDVVMNNVPGPVARLKHDNAEFLMCVSSLACKNLASPI